jgi:hypothetical protein
VLSPWIRLCATALIACSVGFVSSPATAESRWGPSPHNPHLGPQGTATMHGDAQSSDATPLSGPGTGAVSIAGYPLGAACPTILQGSDRLVVALCTTVLGQVPTVYLLDLDDPSPVASLALAKGSLLGGVYAYLDNNDRLVALDGNRELIRVGHARDQSGVWRLTVDHATDLSGVIAADDGATGLVPDWDGNVWFATGNGLVGVVGPSGTVEVVHLPAGEHVANSISSAPNGSVAVASTHALYELTADSGRPRIVWRATYDRGSARKPGQLSWGTGSTPTYFGADYLTIVDNADGPVQLLVYRSGTGELVCSQPVLTHGGPGSENSPVGIGGSVFVASTYGYPYPAVPADAGPAQPESAPFIGGMTRVDVDESGCRTIWDNQVRSAAVPRISTADGNIYTTTRVGLDTTTPLDGFTFTVLDPDTGAVRADHALPGTIVNDTLQTAPLITHDGRVLQGTVTGILRIG